jgi:hypothetical protein
MQTTDTTRGQWDAYLAPLRHLLRERRGALSAVTIDEIAAALALPSRRAAEQLLEDHVGNLGYCVVAGARGYWRPTTAEEINAYRTSLRRRHVALKDREDAVVQAALLEGWQRLGDDFYQPPERQPELFSVTPTLPD